MKYLKIFSLKFYRLYAIILGLLSLSACTYYVETLESSVGDNYLSDFHYSKMVTQFQDAANVIFKGHTLVNGPNITFDTSKVTKTIVLSYGDTLSMFYDGVNRRGVASCSWQGDFFAPGTEIMVSFENGFLCNRWYIDGTMKITYLDKNEYNQPEYLMETTGVQVINKSTQENYNWNNVYTRTKVLGDSTMKSDDDVWSVSGTVYARNQKGRYYNAIIKDSIYFDNRCEYGITKGRVDIAPVDDDQRTFVYYGEIPKCEVWVTFKRGSRVVTVTKNR